MCEPSNKEYCEAMFGCSFCHEKKAPSGKAPCREAYEKAHDVRKFEIDLYWKRALYFWGFEAAFLVAFGTILATKNVDAKYLVLTATSLFAIIFTWLWRLALKGSKRWQENWEAHIDWLEECFSGNLYKTVLSKKGRPLYSVSRTNEAINMLLLALWSLAALVCGGVAWEVPFPGELPTGSWLGYAILVFPFLVVFVLALRSVGNSLKTDLGQDRPQYSVHLRKKPALKRLQPEGRQGNTP